MFFSKIKKSILQITKEMIPVVLGVLIALWINNWQKNKDDKAFLNHVFQAIQKEHDENIMELQQIIPRHERLSDSIYHYINDENMTIQQFPEMIGGLSIALIGNTSWKSFISSDLKLVDFETVKSLSIIDEYKVFYQKQTQRLSDHIFSNIESSKANDKQILLFVLEDLISIEEDLLKEHLNVKTLLQVKK